VTIEEEGKAPRRFRRLVGVGGIGSGVLFALEGSHDLGRNESRPARLLDVRDYCKLHIIAHYPAVLLGARPAGTPFHVVPVGRVGADETGRRLRREMADAGMDVRLVHEVAGRPTLQSVCFQYPDGSGGNITTSDSAAATLLPADVDEAAALLDEGTIALAAPEVGLDVRARLLELAARAGAFRAAALTTAEAKDPRARDLLARVDLLAVNQEEASALSGVPFDPDRPRPCLEACAALVPSEGARVVVTAGRSGAFALAAGGVDHRGAPEVPVASTAGAGDALLGGILAGIAAGATFGDALALGACAAAFSVASPHTIPDGLSREALAAFAGRHGLELPPSLLGRLAGTAEQAP
jgi:sugar/nucleoside kinase (ribokinase family)